jgi:hypothetical protein
VGLSDEKSGVLIPSASYGNAQGFLDGLDIPLEADKSGGRNPAISAARGGRAYVCNDTLHDQRIAIWHDRMRNWSIRSAASVPLLREGKSIGSFSLYASEIDHFDDERVHLLNELAGGIAFALDRFEQETRRRNAEADIHNARQQLQALSIRLLQVQEQERRDIARGLHDEIGQSLTLIKIKLQMALHRGGNDKELTKECVDIASETLEQVRTMSLNLRPPRWMIWVGRRAAMGARASAGGGWLGYRVLCRSPARPAGHGDRNRLLPRRTGGTHQYCASCPGKKNRRASPR